MLIFEITIITSFPLNLKSTKPDNQPIAKLITTPLTWEDLVINEEALSGIEKIREQISGVAPAQNSPVTGAAMQTGLRVLFSGQPGTGKTLTTCLLGKWAALDVYRLNPSKIVSANTTEKKANLSQLFAIAESNRWILYFDAVDALFDEQPAQSSAYNSPAAQKIAYFFQLISTHNGLIIISTSQINKLPDSFLKVFALTVNFSMPDAQQRFRLLQSNFKPIPLAPDVSLADIALKNEITGGDIVNILRYCSLKMLKSGSTQLNLADINEGIQKELHSRPA